MKYYIGVDLGGTAIKTAIIDENYNIIAKKSTKTQAKEGVDVVVADIVSGVHGILEENSMDISQIEHIGFGVPSAINPANNSIVHANNLGWKDVDVLSLLRKYLDKKLYIANDADCAVYGEVLCGGAKGYKHVLMLTLGTGIGGGLVWDGKLCTGGDGGGVEPGHVTMDLSGGICNCGRRGCFEMYASVTALIRNTKKWAMQDPTSIIHEMIDGNYDNVSGRTAFLAAAKGDATAQKIVDEYVGFLAMGISNFICLLRPEAILIGGGLSGEGENLLVPVREVVYKINLGAGILPNTPIIKATLGNDAGLIGAAYLGKSLGND